MKHTETATPFTDFLVGKHDEQGGYGTAGYNELLEHAREQERELATARLELSTERDAVAQYIGERNGLREKLDEESQRNVDMLVTLADHVVAQGRLLAERDTLRTKLNNYGAGWDAAERGHPRDESKGMEWLDGFEYWKALEELEKLRTQLAQAQEMRDRWYQELGDERTRTDQLEADLTYTQKKLAQAQNLVTSALAVFEQSIPREMICSELNPVASWVGKARDFLK